MSHLAKRARIPRRQRGIASILIVVLIGLVMIVTVYGVFRAVRGAQEQTLAVHARTRAEATAWYGAEGIRRYIEEVDPKTLQWWIDHPPSSGAPITLTLSGAGALDSTGAANLEATIVEVKKEVPADVNDKRYLATALITGKAGAGRVKAAAPTEVVYRFQLQSEESAGLELTGPIFKGLVLKGNPKFPSNTDFNVLGSVEIAEINSTGSVNVRDINATTTVTINSAIAARNIHANGDVTLTQNASAQKIDSGGSVLVSGNGTQGEITAEQDVTFKWSRATLVKAGGNLVVGEPYPISCKPGGNGMDATTISTAYVKNDVTWHSCSGGIETLFADGDLVRYHGNALKPDELTSYSATQHLRVKGTMNIFSMNGPLGMFTAQDEITYGPTPRDPAPVPPDNPAHTLIKRLCSNVKVTLAEANTGWANGEVIGYAPAVQASNPAVNDDNLSATTPADKCDFTMPAVAAPVVPEFRVEAPRVDANMLRNRANFEFGIAGGELQVTVRDVIGVSDGVYKLGYKPSDPSNQYSWKMLDYLCPVGQLDAGSTAFDGQKKCLLADAKRIGMGDYGVSCFHFTPSAGAGAPDTYLVGAFAARNWTNCLTTARGVYFFPGDLDLGKETFVATWIATHNIRPLGEHRTIAPKPAGFQKTCKNEAIPNVSGSLVVSASLAATVSDSLCGPSALEDDDIGNIAMIAGHYLPDGSFAGGDITTSGTNKIEGLVVAGDTFTSRGATTVKGNIIASGQGGGTGQAGDFLNDFTLELPTNSEFNTLPCMEPTCMSNMAEVLWSRYR